MAEEKLRLKLVKSIIGVPEKHRRVLKALGLRRRQSEVVKEPGPAIQGMVFKVQHLLKVERVKK